MFLLARARSAIAKSLVIFIVYDTLLTYLLYLLTYLTCVESCRETDYGTSVVWRSASLPAYKFCTCQSCSSSFVYFI